MEELLDDLVSLASVAPDDSPVAEAATRLSRALGPAAGQRFLEALADAALELNDQLPSGRVEVRLAGRDPEFVFVEEVSSSGSSESSQDGLTSRITLRLPDSLKAAVEAAAARDGVSVNTWLVRTVARSAARSSRPPRGNRLRGYATS